MEKTSLRKIMIELQNDNFVYGPGWTNEEEEKDFIFRLKKTMNDCCFDLVMDSFGYDDEYLFNRGEEFIKAGPIYITIFVSQMTSIEVKSALKRNGFVINSFSLCDDKEYYCMNKQEFFDMLDENKEEIEERIKEAFTPPFSENYIKKEMLLSTLKDIDIGFSIMDTGSSMSRWQKDKALVYLNDLFDEMVEDEDIIECFESLTDDDAAIEEHTKVLGYRTNYS